MNSPYNTRSTRTASTAAAAAVNPTTSSTVATTSTTQRRHFCIVLTNNPRMIQSARRMLSNVNLNIPTEQSHQEQQQQRPQRQMQYLQVPSAPIQSRRRAVDDRRQVEQQVPLSIQFQTVPTTTTITSNMLTYEKEIEQDFQAQIQPILQLYLQKTRRSNPINSILDMSNYVQV